MKKGQFALMAILALASVVLVGCSSSAEYSSAPPDLKGKPPTENPPGVAAGGPPAGGTPAPNANVKAKPN